MLAPLALEASEIATLEACVAGGPHPRMRRRAQAVLAHHRGFCIDQLVVLFATHRNVVSRWLGRWQRWGLAGLAEGARSGRPPKLAETVKKK
ncbi:helix-turn-helix domain-containing protein [Hymenobacter lapidarius]|nr:helix-turn-helix domain-containing protein [Hymenobacter lapidarius]